MGVFNLFKKKKEEDNKPTSRFIDDEWLEVSASSKEAAIERACMALNTNASHLEVKVLSKDGKKIQARKTDGVSQETTEETQAPSRQARGRGGNRGGNRGNNRGNSRGGQQRDNRNDRGNSRRPVREEQTDEEMQMSGDDTFDDRQYNEQDSRDFNDRDYNEGSSRRNDRYEENEEDFVEEIEEETDLGRKAKDILTQIVQKIEPNAKIELFETNKTIRLEIVSAESGLFIGKFGQTLDSIQHILKKILEIKFQDGKNLVVDAEDYRVRREESIESKARKLAKKARQEGRPVSVEPMNAMDRRIVHMALKGEPGIETKSVGEGSSRRVLIVPKRRSQGRNGGGRDGGRGRGRGGRDGGRNFRGRGDDRQGGGRGRDGNSRMHDSYDVPALPKNDVFGDNPEEYFENYDDEK